MWPFRKAQEPSAAPPLALRTLEDDFRALKREWLDVESKLIKLYSRNVKAAARLEAAEQRLEASDRQALASTEADPNGRPGRMDKSELRQLAALQRRAR